jgi:ubiquinol-cytochrome c reductase cytochrome c1 subunit
MFRVRSFAAAVLFGTMLAVPQARADESAVPPMMNGDFSFNQPLGQIDMAAAQRGFQIYREVCSTCHALVEMSYQDLSGLGYTDDQIRAIAADAKVADIKDDGTPTERPAKPSDRIARPFPNEKAARAANNGAAPPDLALIVNAREGGANYVYSILQGFKDPPHDFKMADGMNYNVYFANGNQQIAMPQPLQDASVTYADGSKNDLQHEAHDVATFLEWASNPELNERKRMGVMVLIFLGVLVGVLVIGKRHIWKDVQH